MPDKMGSYSEERKIFSSSFSEKERISDIWEATRNSRQTSSASEKTVPKHRNIEYKPVDSDPL